jgi:integrase
MAERLDDLCASFKRHLRAEKKAARTATLDELTRSAIREWLAEIGETRQASTVRTRFKGLHRFCSWLVSEGELVEHPMRTLTAPAAADKPVPVLNDDELAALVKACAGKDFTDRRDEALIRLLLDTAVSKSWWGSSQRTMGLRTNPRSEGEDGREGHGTGVSADPAGVSAMLAFLQRSWLDAH